jgi:hypothetical protein
MTINIVPIEDNKKPRKTREQFLQELKAEYEEDKLTEGRTFELAADLMVLRQDLFEAIAIATLNDKRDLLQSLYSVRRNLGIDLSWPISTDEELRHQTGDTFIDALNTFRSFDGSDVLRDFIERLQKLSGYTLE